jgi:hypothetical protein
MSAPKPTDRFSRFLFLSAVAACTLWGYWRIHTYATGQDPRTFLLLAKGWLTGRVTVDPGFVVPGWPLVLAAVIKLFGIHAAFWSNVPLFVLLVRTLQLLLEELTGSFRRSAAMAAGAVLLLLGGYALNPHFLLWVFRQTPMYLAGVLAWLCLVRAVRRQAEGRLGAAAAWLGGTMAATVAGVLVRETGVLLLPAMGLYLLAVGLGWAGPDPAAGRPARGRWFLFALSAGIALAALIGGVLATWFLRLPLVTGQASYIIEKAPVLLARPFREWPVLAMLAGIPEEFGGIGLLALLLGIREAFRRGNRDFLFVFLLPALAYLVFDGLIKFHRRFFLSTLFFLAPLAMLGAVAAGRWLAGMARRRLVRAGWPDGRLARAGRTARAAVWLALAGWGAWTVAHIVPWGLKVTSAEVDRAVEVLAPWTGPDRPLLVDGRTRYLNDVLEVFTDWPLEQVREEGLAGYVRNPPLVYVQPDDEAAIYRHGGVPSHSADAVLADHLSLVPLPGGGGGFSLGNSSYRLVQVVPWTRRQAAVRLPPVPGLAGAVPPPCVLLRLAVPAGVADMPVRVSLAGHPLRDTRFRPGAWLLAVPWDLLQKVREEQGEEADGPELVLEADGPIPDAFDAVWCPPDGPLEMPFGPKQAPSFDSYLSWANQAYDGLQEGDYEWLRFPVPIRSSEFRGDGTVSLPAGLDGGEAPADFLYLVKLAMSAVCGNGEGRLAVSLSVPEFPEIPPQTDERSPSDRQQIFRFVLDGLPRAPERLGLHVENKTGYPEEMLANPRHANVQLDTLQVYAIRRTDAVSVQVGTFGDAALLGDGFFSRESPHSAEHGRWTEGEFDLLLPLKGGRDYRFALDFSQLRPEGESPAVPELELNGHPLETRATDTGLEARLPAEWMAGVNRLAVRTGTWSPADHGANDRRCLGIYLRAVRAEPI